MEKTILESPCFVFLHGAGLGAWIWEEVIKKISHPCLAVDLPGRGKHGDITTNNLRVNDYVESVLADIEQFCCQKIIIVAHSISGVIGLEISNRLKDRISGFVAVSACIPSANGSYVSSMPLVAGLFLRCMFKFAGTRPPGIALRNGLCNDLEEKQTLNVIKRFVPESIYLYTDKIQAKNVPENSIYVYLKKDKAFGEAMQKKMIANLRAKQVIAMESGHLPMLRKPDEIAQILNHYAIQVSHQNKDIGISHIL